MSVSSLISYWLILLFLSLFFGYGNGFSCVGQVAVCDDAKEERPFQPDAEYCLWSSTTLPGHFDIWKSYRTGIFRVHFIVDSHTLYQTVCYGKQMVDMPACSWRNLPGYSHLHSEFIPRAVLAGKANLWIRILILPAFVFYLLLFPVVTLVVFLSRAVLTFFGIRSDSANEGVLGRQELDSYVRKGFEDISGDQEVDSEVKIFRNALDFSSMRVRDCMVPRADIVAIKRDEDIEKLKELFVESGISRILVYGEDIDDILGYIHVWEMFNAPVDWTQRITPASFVPESMPASKLMNDLMQQRKSIAVVVDEFGGTSGVVTMEDLVEEIFGDIEDEYDSKVRFVKQVSDSEYILSGGWR